MPHILAEAGFSFLIYLVIGVLWLIGNISQQKKAKAKAEEMRKRRLEREDAQRRTGKRPAPSKQENIERDLEEFLGRLTGTSPAVTPKPAEPQIRRQVTVQKTNKPIIKFDPGREPSPQKAPPPPPPPIPASAKKPSAVPIQHSYDLKEVDTSFKDIEDLKEVKEIIKDMQDGEQVKQDALENVQSLLIDLSRTMISMPSMPIQSIRPVRTKTDYPDLKKEASFRKALISSVLLEKPKALQPRPFEGTD